MPRSSRSYAMVSDAALGSLCELGRRLREARLRRNWTQAVVADKSGLSASSIKKVEGGSPHITVAAYLALLDVYGHPTGLDEVMAQGQDTLGESLSRADLRKRARGQRPEEADEWEI